MRGVGIFVLGLIVGLATIVVLRLTGIDLVAHLQHHFASRTNASVTHTEAKFEFTANGPLARVAPLMGADREKVWAPGWNPHFLFPKPAADRQGMVFMVDHGPYRVPWVNTEFDPGAGRVQYVYTIPNTLVTVITIRLTPAGDKTHVAVQYDRTALMVDANDRVQQLAENDWKSGPEWEGQINGWLQKESRTR